MEMHRFECDVDTYLLITEKNARLRSFDSNWKIKLSKYTELPGVSKIGQCYCCAFRLIWNVGDIYAVYAKRTEKLGQDWPV